MWISYTAHFCLHSSSSFAAEVWCFNKQLVAFPHFLHCGSQLHDNTVNTYCHSHSKLIHKVPSSDCSSGSSCTSLQHLGDETSAWRVTQTPKIWSVTTLERKLVVGSTVFLGGPQGSTYTQKLPPGTRHCFHSSISWVVQGEAAVVSVDVNKHNPHCFIHVYKR